MAFASSKTSLVPVTSHKINDFYQYGIDFLHTKTFDMKHFTNMTVLKKTYIERKTRDAHLKPFFAWIEFSSYNLNENDRLG